MKHGKPKYPVPCDIYCRFVHDELWQPWVPQRAWLLLLECSHQCWKTSRLTRPALTREPRKQATGLHVWDMCLSYFSYHFLFLLYHTRWKESDIPRAVLQYSKLLQDIFRLEFQVVVRHLGIFQVVIRHLGIFQVVVRHLGIFQVVVRYLGIFQVVVLHLGIFQAVVAVKHLGIFQVVVRHLGIFLVTVWHLGIFQAVVLVKHLGIFQVVVRHLGIFQVVVRHLRIFQVVVRHLGILQAVVR